ncbi:carbohydrate ABC transporter permease [Thermostaphylospora chromogena]|uniref:Cellobiose ABC transporter membrane protein n=1 Tax=Thermostaphylospora chromogena TaxID=35622 RepID=A0A1H1EVA8_9ACTN|nr:sugar ABC transporter permease [Thermostaphylospora chromogena]SDQ92066.1 cellobiose ABC transporter membrane protein [Thermostaphylospora chromogena]
MATRAPDRPAAPPGAPSRRAARATRRGLLHLLDTKVSPYAYVAPFFLLFSAFGLFPLVYTAWVSLHEWTLLSDDHVFLGLDNFSTLLADGYFWNATFNTLSIGVLSTVPQLMLAIWLAHLLNRPLRAQTFFRITLLLPNVTSVVAVVVIFSQLFGRDFGLINWVLSWFGAGRIDWAAGTATSHVAISVMIMWRWTGYNALIYLAAMQAVPRELYEAARLDGASGMTQLRKITIPMIRPTIIFTVIVSTIGAMQILAEPLLFAATTSGPGSMVTGGPDRQFQTLALYVYEHGFTNFDFGYASAASWVMFLFVAAAAGINYLLTRRLGGEVR